MQSVTANMCQTIDIMVESIEFRIQSFSRHACDIANLLSKWRRMQLSKIIWLTGKSIRGWSRWKVCDRDLHTYTQRQDWTGEIACILATWLSHYYVWSGEVKWLSWRSARPTTPSCVSSGRCLRAMSTLVKREDGVSTVNQRLGESRPVSAPGRNTARAYSNPMAVIEPSAANWLEGEMGQI